MPWRPCCCCTARASRAASTTAGDIVPLAGQPRDRWDAGLLRLGFAHLQASQRGDLLSRWHLLAGIAGEHALAPDHAGTDWQAIVRYYEQLLTLDASAAPRLGHAIALAEAGAPADAMQHLQVLLPQVPAALRAHTLAALARAAERLGDVTDRGSLAGPGHRRCTTRGRCAAAGAAAGAAVGGLTLPVPGPHKPPLNGDDRGPHEQ